MAGFRTDTALAVYHGARILALVGALAAAFTAGASSASAADLGGNCCADLEERIAELERPAKATARLA